MTKHAPRTTEGRGRLYDSVVDTIGDTPCIRVNRLAPKHVRLYVKAEFFNPAASVKDRLAISIIEEAERSGALKPGQTVVEATSGNTGIGLAMVVCSQRLSARGHDGRLVFGRAPSPDALSRRQGRAHPTCREGPGHVPEGAGTGRGERLVPGAAVRDIGQRHDPRRTRRHANCSPTSPASASTTGSRGYGTGGTVSGVGRVLRKERPQTKIILSEPTIAQLLGSGVAQQRGADHAPIASHPAFTPHPIQGWTPDFIPYVLQEAVDGRYYDEVIAVAGPDAIAWSRRLATEEGIFTGISGGASLAVAVQVAERAPKGSVICCMLPDTGERYLSTPLFEGVATDMTPEEDALSRSTPGFQMPAA